MPLSPVSEHGGVAGGGLRGDFEQGGGLLRGSQKPFHSGQPLQARLERAVFLAQRLNFQRARHGLANLLRAEGLGHVIVSAQTHRLDRGRNRAKGGHNNDRHCGTQVLHLFQQRNPVHVFHPHVGQHQVGCGRGAQARQSLRGVARFHDAVARGLQRCGEHPANVTVIVNNQDVSQASAPLGESRP